MQKKPQKYISKEVALKKLQAYCAYQDRCHQEVRKKLLDLGIYGDDLEEIVADLIVDKFLDEERFARAYARGKFRHKKWGRFKIRQHLKQKQISAYCLKKAMEEIEEEDYQKTLEQLLQKKRRLLKVDNIYQEKQKLAVYAINKGYESPLVWETIHRLVKQEN
ncbi:MAG: regulatory protein RecX [Bacteroidota bacterium]